MYLIKKIRSICITLRHTSKWYRMYTMSACMLLAIVLLVCNAVYVSSSSSIWPLPNEFTSGDKDVTISPHLFVKSCKCKTLQYNFNRYHELIFTHTTSNSNGNSSSSSYDKDTINVIVDDLSEAYPQLDTDESYTITISADDKEISLHSATVYGAVLGLESLSQLIQFDPITESYIISGTPIVIHDKPRFQHRGLLLDTSRHYQSISFIKEVLDGMSYSKLNVLHWHAVDTEAFPFESKTRPHLWDGAYSMQERYTQNDIIDIVEYSRLRSIKVLIEFDVPGHAASWCVGYPDICPSTTCTQPLDPSNEDTFTLINDLLSECTHGEQGQGLFPYDLFHLGGDEVNYTCWEESAEIMSWATENNLSTPEDIYKYFVDKASSMTIAQKRRPVQWVEVFETFGSALSKDVIIDVWKEASDLNLVLQAGYNAIMSSQEYWYLDHLQLTWEDFYNFEPTDGLSADVDESLLIGVSVSMWGETVDGSDVINTIFPRASAFSERAWTSLDMIDADAAHDRLATFRCLLIQRGIGAAPVDNKIGRFSPKSPGSCYTQR